MPINAHPDFLAAEREYLIANTLEEKILKLKKMISFAPAHKGGENLRAQLKTRLKKFQQQLERSKKSGKSSKKGIKKADMQAIIIGLTNTGKSSLISILTNNNPPIAEYKFTTQTPQIGTMNYETVQIQILENPSIFSENYDKGLTNTADTILILITSLNQLKDIEPLLEKTKSKKIIVFNKIDLLNLSEKRKISATLKTKKHNYVLISTKTKENLEELKEKLFQSFNKIRVYTKDPNKKEKTSKPIILQPESTVEDVAEKILTGFARKVKETKIWGPSSKFGGQKIGLKHKLKDLDVVEFKTY